MLTKPHEVNIQQHHQTCPGYNTELSTCFSYHRSGKTVSKVLWLSKGNRWEKDPSLSKWKLILGGLDTDSFFCLPDRLSRVLGKSGTAYRLLGAHSAPGVETRRAATAGEIGKDLPSQPGSLGFFAEAFLWTFQLCFCPCSCHSWSLKDAQNQAAEDTQRNHLACSLWRMDQLYFVISGICHSSYMSSLSLKPSSDGATQPHKAVWFSVLLLYCYRVLTDNSACLSCCS